MNKALLSIVLVAAALVSSWRIMDLNQTLLIQLKENRRLTEKARLLENELKAASAIPVPVMQDPNGREQQLELLQLRGEVGFLRNESRDLKMMLNQKDRPDSVAATNWFDWSIRPQPSPLQSRLANLKRGLERAAVNDSQRDATVAEIQQLEAKLGTDRYVRYSRPKELVLISSSQSGIAMIYNPTAETLLFGVNTKDSTGDGTARRRSEPQVLMLPPGGWLKVPNLKFTTPTMRMME